jgi:hypothetical protein
MKVQSTEKKMVSRQDARTPRIENALYSCVAEGRRQFFSIYKGFRPFGALIPNPKTYIFGFGVLPILEERAGERTIV